MQRKGLKKWVNAYEFILDVTEKYAIILSSAIIIPRQLYYAQLATGGRLGESLCQT